MAFVPPVEPPTVGPSSIAGGGAAPVQSLIDLPATALQQPTSGQAQDFARAVATPMDVQAARPAAGGGLVERIAQQASALAQHVQSPLATPASARGDAAAPSGKAEDISAAMISQMEHAYMVAIETTLASRGSTESTKVFNTLLKGQ